MIRLLVTGFGPFPRMPRNPSADIARRVAAAPRLRLLGIEAKAAILTTAYATLADELGPLLAEEPDVVLLIGVAGRSAKVRVERRATARRSTLFPDVLGDRPTCVRGEGTSTRPSARLTRVNTHMAVLALVRHGLPVRLSRDAGRYLCNAAYFRALERARPTLFIHIPKRPVARRGMAGSRRVGALWDCALAAALVDIAVALGREARVVGATAIA